MSVKKLSVPQLVGRALEGDRRAIGRMLTLIERGGESADEITDLTHPAANGATSSASPAHLAPASRPSPAN